MLRDRTIGIDASYMEEHFAGLLPWILAAMNIRSEKTMTKTESYCQVMPSL